MMLEYSHSGSRWVDFGRRGIAVTPGAIRAFVLDRWRCRDISLSGLRSFAGGLRRVTRVLPVALMPEHVFDRWAAQGWPECWVTYRPNGMSCLIIIPGERVIRVPRADCARMQAQFVTAAAVQSQFSDVAPRVLEVGDGGTYIAEAHLSLSRGWIGESEIEATVRRMHEIAPHRTTQVSALVSAMLSGLDLSHGIHGFATDLCARHGESHVPIRQVHGDLMPHNLWRRSDGRLVALDWEFSREAPASYDLWHLNFLPWLRGEITLDRWMKIFARQLDRCLPFERPKVWLHHRLNTLSTGAFLLRTGYEAYVPEKMAAIVRLSGSDLRQGR